MAAIRIQGGPVAMDDMVKRYDPFQQFNPHSPIGDVGALIDQATRFGADFDVNDVDYSPWSFGEQWSEDWDRALTIGLDIEKTRYQNVRGPYPCMCRPGHACSWCTDS